MTYWRQREGTAEGISTLGATQYEFVTRPTGLTHRVNGLILFWHRGSLTNVHALTRCGRPLARPWLLAHQPERRVCATCAAAVVPSDPKTSPAPTAGGGQRREG